MKTLNSPSGWGYMADWVLLVASTVGAALWGTASVILWEIWNWNQSGRYGYHDEMGNWVPYESPWRGVMDKTALEEKMEIFGFTAIAFIAAAVVLLVIVMIKTGKFGRGEDMDRSACGAGNLLRCGFLPAGDSAF